VADLTLTPPRTRTPGRAVFASLAKKLAAIAVSYEVATYALATVQAVGLTLPTMVNAGPGEAKVACQGDMKSLLDAAERWGESHPGAPLGGLRLEQLVPYLGHGLPTCPDGGTYEIVRAGHTLRMEEGQVAVVPEGRIGVRCVHEAGVDGPHGGFILNPFKEPGKFGPRGGASGLDSPRPDQRPPAFSMVIR
jgi:hypothetical protein